MDVMLPRLSGFDLVAFYQLAVLPDPGGVIDVEQGWFVDATFDLLRAEPSQSIRAGWEMTFRLLEKTELVADQPPAEGVGPSVAGETVDRRLVERGANSAPSMLGVDGHESMVRGGGKKPGTRTGFSTRNP